MSVCLIPLRAGSKRLKDKNVISFFGSPIFTYPLSTARQSGLFSKIIIACDKEYEELVRKSVPLNTSFNTDTIIYVRNPSNSKDESGLIDLVRELVSHFAIADETMCILYSTSVLTTIQHLIDGFNILNKEKRVSVYPVVRIGNDLYEYDSETNDLYQGYMENDINSYNADSWFIFKIKEILKRRNIISFNYSIPRDGGLVISDIECQPVHTQEDIEDLKKKYRLMQIDKIERQNEYIKRCE